MDYRNYFSNKMLYRMLFMVIVHKQKMAVVLCAALLVSSVSFPMDVQEDVIVVSEHVQEQSNEPSVAWYKDESNQKIATGVIITAAVVYAIAVRMGKVSSPFAMCSAIANCWARKKNAQHNQSETDKKHGAGSHNNGKHKETVTEPVKPAHETTTHHKVEKAEDENTLAAVGKQWFVTKFLIEKVKCFESRREGFDPVA